MLITKPSGEFAILSPFAITAFPAYMGKKRGARRKRDYCQTLIHFIYSEKFRGNEKLREEILNIPSPREVEKRQRMLSNEGMARQDWEMVREAVIECGIRFVVSTFHEAYALLEVGEQPITYQSNTNNELGNSGINLYGHALEKVRSKIQGNSFVRVALLGETPDKSQTEKLTNLFSKSRPDFVSYNPDNPEFENFALEWIQENYAVPMEMPETIRPGMMTHAVIFGEKADQAVIERAMSLHGMGVKTRIIGKT